MTRIPGEGASSRSANIVFGGDLAYEMDVGIGQGHGLASGHFVAPGWRVKYNRMSFWRKITRLKIGCVTILVFQLFVLVLAYQFVWVGYLGSQGPVSGPRWDAPSADATWPWSGASTDQPIAGVTHWHKTTSDGTSLDFVRFDFVANPKLRFEMYDQDQDGPMPWSNKVKFYDLGVAQAAAHLDSTGRGKVIAATNGVFFDCTKFTSSGIASHVAPVVVDGSTHAFGRSQRWTFGVKYVAGKPHFDAIHAPAPSVLASRFDFAAGGAQVLIWDGVQAASPAEQTGTDSSFEKMRTSRVAWGWSQDDRYLYLLFVKEPDEEMVSKIAAEHHMSQGGGWMLADERTCLAKLGVWRAFNSDAGDTGQMILIRPDGKYDVVPPKNLLSPMRQVLGSDAKGWPNTGPAPVDGALMYWFVSATK